MNVQNILVTNALSDQGFAVAQTLKKCGRVGVKALVDPSGGDPSALHKLGIDTTVAVMDENTCRQILQGVDGVFLCLNFTNNPSMEEKVVDQGRTFVNVCKELGTVKRIIYSSHENCEEFSGGKYHMPEFIGACQIAEVLKNSGIPNVELRFGFLMDRLKDLVKFNDQDRVYEFLIPMADKPLDLIAPEDVGKVVCDFFLTAKELNQSLAISGDSLTIEQIAETFTKVTHKAARYPEISVKRFKEIIGLPDAEQLGSQFHYFQDMSGKLFDVKKSRQMFPDLLTFEQWIQTGTWEITEQRR